MTPARALLPVLALLALSACSWPRANANVHVTPNGVRVVPSLHTTFAGVGVNVSP
ncbi:MAG: hypothetical protein U1E48_05200 [Paracoccaceae bacterium]